MLEFLRELRDHWADGYWWADHQLLLMVLMGLIGLVFHAIQLWMSRHWGAEHG